MNHRQVGLSLMLSLMLVSSVFAANLTTIEEWRSEHPDYKHGYLIGFTEALKTLGLRCAKSVDDEILRAQLENQYAPGDGLALAIAAYFVMRECGFSSDPKSVNIRRMFPDPYQQEGGGQVVPESR